MLGLSVLFLLCIDTNQPVGATDGPTIGIFTALLYSKIVLHEFSPTGANMFKAFILLLAGVSLAYFLSLNPGTLEKEALIEKYSNEQSRFIPIDGMQVHYRDEGAGELVVLIHGTASSLHTWDQWTKQLSAHYRVIRLDLPGFGLTGPHPQNKYEVQDDVQFMRNFLQALMINDPQKQVHLVGNSLGGRIAWQYSLRFPGQVKSLTLMNALGYPQEQWPPAIEMAQWPVVDEIVARFSPRFMFEDGLKEVYFDDALVNTQLVDRYFQLANFPGNMAAFPKRVQAKLDTQSDNIKDISVPTLIQWGARDEYFPVARAYDFKRDIKGSKLKVYTDIGHLPMEETPKKSAEDFRLFLADLLVSQ